MNFTPLTSPPRIGPGSCSNLRCNKYAPDRSTWIAVHLGHAGYKRYTLCSGNCLAQWAVDNSPGPLKIHWADAHNRDARRAAILPK